MYWDSPTLLDKQQIKQACLASRYQLGIPVRCPPDLGWPAGMLCAEAACTCKTLSCRAHSCDLLVCAYSGCQKYGSSPKGSKCCSDPGCSGQRAGPPQAGLGGSWHGLLWSWLLLPAPYSGLSCMKTGIWQSWCDVRHELLGWDCRLQSLLNPVQAHDATVIQPALHDLSCRCFAA